VRFRRLPDSFAGPLAAAALALTLLLGSCEKVAQKAPAGRTATGAPTVAPADAPAVLAAVRAPGAKAVVLNVWATWCEPCREEFPDLVRLGHEYGGRGVRLVLVSGDFDSERPAVTQFLNEQGVDFATYIKSGDDMKFINGLNPKWTGALPATFVYDGQGRLRDFWEGKASYAKMEERLRRVLAGGGADSTGVRT
jgi:thiol-disulfide isomerase/thioredoxin